jgi:ABC-type transport system involved in multi-copper enzyme maturation permease subunit
MRNFANILKGELIKSFKGKRLLKTIVFVIGIVIFMALIFGVTVKEYVKLYPIDENIAEISPSDVITGAELEIQDNAEAYERGDITKYERDIRNYQHKSTIAIAKYMVKHDLSYGDFAHFNSDDMLRTLSLQNLVFFILQGSGLIIGIIASILAAGAISDEIHDGTMRLLLICPVSRSKLITAKLITIVIQLLIVLLTAVAAGLILGLIMYPIEWTRVMLVINAAKAALVSFPVTILIYLMSLLLFGSMLALFIMTFVFVFRSKAFGIVIGVILSTNVLATALLLRPELIDFFSYTVLTNMNLSGYFTLYGNPTGQIALPMAIIVYIINIVVLLIISGLIFKQRDIN